MKKQEKLFLHLFTRYTEAYGGMEALKKMNEILNKPDSMFWDDLRVAIDHQHRVVTDGVTGSNVSGEKIKESVQRQMNKLLSNE